MKTSKPSVTAFLLFIGIAAFFYNILPGFTSTADSIVSSIVSKLHNSIPPPSACTKEIGEGLCCELHMAAEPCLDECRKNHLDRTTFTPTKDYDECADQCLVVYQSTCTKKDKLNDSNGIRIGRLASEIRSLRRGWRNRT